MTLYIYGRVTKDCKNDPYVGDADISAGDWVLCYIKLTSSVGQNYGLIAVHKSIEREIDDSEVYVDLVCGNGLCLDTEFKDAKVFTDDAALFTILDQFQRDILNYELRNNIPKNTNTTDYYDNYYDTTRTPRRSWTDGTSIAPEDIDRIEITCNANKGD